MKATSLLEALDKIRPELEPLDIHYLTQKDELTRDRYLTFLVANLLEDGALNESQSRLFDMLLASTNTSKNLSFYCQQLASLELAELKDVITLLKSDAALGNAFLFDLMVLIRTKGGPFSTKHCDRLSKLATIFDVDEVTLNILLFWCKFLLIEPGYEINTDCIEVVYATHTRYDRDAERHKHFLNLYSEELEAGDLLESGSFQISSWDSNYNDRYNIVCYPRGVITFVYPKIDGKRIWTMQDKKEAFNIIKFPDELNAWWSTICEV